MTADRSDQTAVPTTGAVSELPVLPLIETVAFPKVSIPLQVSRPGSLWAIRQAEDGDGTVVLITQKRRDRRKAKPENLNAVGTVARIVRTYRVRANSRLSKSRLFAVR